MSLENFRSVLREELLSRCRSNPQYSLRAFARNLKVEPSALCKILHGKRAISKLMAQRLGQQLGLSVAEIEGFLTEKRGADGYVSLSLDTFKLISNWYYYAILELTYVEEFQPHLSWIAEALGLSKVVVADAVERLKLLGLLTEGSDGKWVDRSNDVTTLGSAPTAYALRQFQRQLLEKAIDALERVPLPQRDQTSMTFAFDSRRLKEAKHRLKKFRRAFSNFAANSPKKDRVYQLVISLFPLQQSSSSETQHEA